MPHIVKRSQDIFQWNNPTHTKFEVQRSVASRAGGGYRGPEWRVISSSSSSIIYIYCWTCYLLWDAIRPGENTFFHHLWKQIKVKREKIGPAVHESDFTAKERTMHERGGRCAALRGAAQPYMPSIKAETFCSDCYTGRLWKKPSDRSAHVISLWGAEMKWSRLVCVVWARAERHLLQRCTASPAATEPNSEDNGASVPP